MQFGLSSAYKQIFTSLKSVKISENSTSLFTRIQETRVFSAYRFCLTSSFACDISLCDFISWQLQISGRQNQNRATSVLGSSFTIPDKCASTLPPRWRGEASDDVFLHFINFIFQCYIQKYLNFIDSSHVRLPLRWPIAVAVVLPFFRFSSCFWVAGVCYP